MQGVKIERAVPSNNIDIYPLYLDFIKESEGANKPYPKIPQAIQRKFYQDILFRAFEDPNQIMWLARRGKTYMGFAHAHILPRPPKGYILYIHTLFVQKHRRKLGIAKLLADAMESEARNLGLSAIELMCTPLLSPKWEKHGAKKVYDYLVKEL